MDKVNNKINEIRKTAKEENIIECIDDDISENVKKEAGIKDKS